MVLEHDQPVGTDHGIYRLPGVCFEDGHGLAAEGHEEGRASEVLILCDPAHVIESVMIEFVGGPHDGFVITVNVDAPKRVEDWPEILTPGMDDGHEYRRPEGDEVAPAKEARAAGRPVRYWYVERT